MATKGARPVPSGYITLSEAARRLGLSRDQAEWLMRTGRIPSAIKVGFIWAVPAHWVRYYRKRLGAVPEGYTTIDQAAETLGLPRRQVMKMLKCGEIEGSICINGRHLVPLVWVEAEKNKRGVAPEDKQAKVLALLSGGMKPKEAAASLGISLTTLYRWRG